MYAWNAGGPMAGKLRLGAERAVVQRDLFFHEIHPRTQRSHDSDFRL